MDLSSVQINTKKIFPLIVEIIEKEFIIELSIDSYLLIEIDKRFQKTLERYEIDKPSLSKISSAMAFWIRKLKPLHYTKKPENYYHFTNELAGLLFAIFIYFNKHTSNIDTVSKVLYRLKQDRLFQDLLKSYRYNSHSPHSSNILFELMFSTTALKNLLRNT